MEHSPGETITLKLIPISHRIQAGHRYEFDDTQMKFEQPSPLPSSIRALLQLEIALEYRV